MNADSIQNWVFVTGVIRSGTTFVGKILSTPLEVDYIHEPFNTGCGMPGMQRRYRYVHPDLHTEEMAHIHSLAKKVFTYDFSLKTSYYPHDPWYKRFTKKIVGSRGPFYLRLAKLNPFHTAAVIKDPTGSLMTQYLYHRFGVKPVILIRHPVSLVASFERLNWWPETEKLLEQPHFVNDCLRENFIDYDIGEDDMVGRACVHWSIINRVLLNWAEKYDWIIIRHEDLCRDPLPVFRHVFNELDLPWSPRVESRIVKLTNSNSAVTSRNEVQNFKRNSEDIFETRRDSVPLPLRERVFELTKDVALDLYSEESYALTDKV